MVELVCCDVGLWLELRRTAAPTTERGRTREGVGERGQAIARMVGVSS